MSLSNSIAGKYRVGNSGRNGFQSSLIVGWIYLVGDYYVMLIGYEDDQAIVKYRNGSEEKVEKKSLKIVVS